MNAIHSTPVAHRNNSALDLQRFGGQPGSYGNSLNPSNRPTAEPAVNVSLLESLILEYLGDCEFKLLSARTLETRRVFFRNFLWFLNYRGYTACGQRELRQFFYYLMHGHEEPGGRFGNPQLNRAVRPITVKDYYNCLRPFFDWLVARGRLVATPFAHIPSSHAPEETKTALSADHIQALLTAAEASTTPDRDRAILALLLDTGCRASELVSIRHKDIDLVHGRCQVLGKGNKNRTVFFGNKTAEAASCYMEITGGGPESVLFPPTRGNGPFTRSGLLQVIKRLGEAAGIKDVATVHAMRRSFAVQMLRNGANVFSVQAMLGHTTLQQTRKYCFLALADSEAQHRQFSPMDRLPTPQTASARA